MRLRDLKEAVQGHAVVSDQLKLESRTVRLQNLSSSHIRLVCHLLSLHSFGFVVCGESWSLVLREESGESGRVQPFSGFLQQGNEQASGWDVG